MRHDGCNSNVVSRAAEGVHIGRRIFIIHIHNIAAGTVIEGNGRKIDLRHE